MEINWIEIKVWMKINIYSNKKALWVPKGLFTIKRFYKIWWNDHIELKGNLSQTVVWNIDMLKLVDFKKI
jgi:hypothetical protein